MICHNLVTINQAGFRGLISFDKKSAAGLTHDVHWSESHAATRTRSEVPRVAIILVAPQLRPKLGCRTMRSDCQSIR